MASAEHTRWRWSDQLGWITAVCVAAALQAIVVWRSPLIARDGIDFIRYAQSLPTLGRQALVIQDQHPGYPLMVLASTAFAQICTDSETSLWILAARIPSSLLGLGCVLVIWLMTRRLFDRWTANLAALVFAVLPLFRQNAADGLSDSPHLFFYLLAAWLACEGLARKTWPWWAGAGAASSAAYWIRPEGLAVALVAGTMLVLLAIVQRGRELPRLALCAVALAGAVVLLATPYPVLSGKLTSKQNPYAQQQPREAFLINEARFEHEREAAEQAVAEDEDAETEADKSTANAGPAAPAVAIVAPTTPASKPVAFESDESQITAGFLAKTLGAALYELGDELARGFRFYFLVFYLLGYLELRRRTLDTRLLVFLYGLAGLHTAVLLGVYCMSGYISHRHVMPLIALAIPWIALGIVYAGDYLQQLTRLRTPRSVFAGLIAVVSCAIVLPRATRELHTAFLPALQAAGWINRHSHPNDRLLSNSKYISYFSGRSTVLLSDRTPEIQKVLAAAGAGEDYQFALLDMTEEGYLPCWLDQLTPTVHPLRQFDALVRGEVRPRVLVLEHDAEVADKSTSPATENRAANPAATVDTLR